MPTFEELCNELKLTDSYERYPQLTALKTWCFNHISSEIDYTGRPQEKYLKYRTLVKNYLELFLPEVETNEKSNTPILSQQLIVFAVIHGYEKYIRSQPRIEQSLLDYVDSQDTVLHKGATEGHVSIVRTLLSHGADVRIRNHQGVTALTSALVLPFFNTRLKSQKETIFRELLEKAPDLIFDQDKEGNNILHHMASAEFDSLLKETLKKEPNLAFLPNKKKEYPIHVAIANRQVKNVAALLQIQGVAALVDAQERTTIHYAAIYGTPKIVELCCNAIPEEYYVVFSEKEPKKEDFDGVNQNQFVLTHHDLWFFDAFTRILHARNASIEIVAKLKERFQSTKNHLTSPEDIKVLQTSSVHFFRSYLNARDIDGKTALHLAAECKNLSALKVLFAYPIKIKKPDYQDRTFLYYVIQNEDLEMLGYIMSQLSHRTFSSLLGKIDEKDLNLLDYIRLAGNSEMDQLLVKHGVEEVGYRFNA